MSTSATRWIEPALELDKRALGKLITAVEDQRPAAGAVREQIFAALAERPVAPTVGITGAPGVGKSTLVAALCRELLAVPEERVAVLAVDPSSQISGGAVLGDRTRLAMSSLPAGLGERLFFRSQAAGGVLGGLSPGTYHAVAALRRIASLVLVETVGVGQSELDVCHLGDLSVVLIAPEGGDDVQFMKAGLIELADLLLVTKSDLGADPTLARLRSTLPGREVGAVSARTGEGVAELAARMGSLAPPSPQVLGQRDRYFFRRWVARSYGLLGLQALDAWSPREEPGEARERAFHRYFVAWLR